MSKYLLKIANVYYLRKGGHTQLPGGGAPREDINLGPSNDEGFGAGGGSGVKFFSRG